MSRNKTNIKMQLNKRLDALLRIGIKKTNANRDTRNGFNPTRYEGIHSVKTADTYRRSINIFGEFCKRIGVKEIEQIDESVVGRFVEERKSNSSWTHSKDISAINKVLGTDYKSEQFDIEKRKNKNIVHNRQILTSNSTASAARNQEALWFAHATGARRESFQSLTPGHAIRSADGIVMGFQFKEKGGRERNALILPSERQAMTLFVDRKLSEVGEDGQLVKPCDSNANPHFERAHYAKDMYAQMVEYKARNEEIYDGYRSIFLNENNYQKAIHHPRYSSDIVHGYDTRICAELSQQLGHNRIEVVINSYLRK